MSADVDTLRRGAKAARDEWADETSGPFANAARIHLAVADWLDTAGADVWAHGPLCICGTGCDACDDNLWEPHARDALVVARAYLGES